MSHLDFSLTVGRAPLRRCEIYKRDHGAVVPPLVPVETCQNNTNYRSWC